MTAETKKSSAMPEGKYTIVGIDVDTTGRRLIDEMIQLSAYTPTDSFSEYIMPYMLLEAMAKYDLTERFLKTCKSFANIYTLTEDMCPDSGKNQNLKQLAKVLLDVNDDSEKTDKNRRHLYTESSASVRSRLVYEITKRLACGDPDKCDGLDEKMMLLETVLQYATPVESEISQLKEETICLERQNSFRPVFVLYFQMSLFHRVKAVTFRRVLANNGLDLNSLENTWNLSKKEGLSKVINTIPLDIKDEEKEELVNLFDSYFDPEKETIKPTLKKTRRRRSPKKTRSARKQNNPSDTEQDSPKATELPDTTVETPSKQPEPTNHLISTNTATTEVC